MQTFYEWLSQLNLLRRLSETYYTFDPEQYNQLFNQELQQIIARTSDPAHRQIMERMLGFDWLSKIVSIGATGRSRNRAAIRSTCRKIASSSAWTRTKMRWIA
jgi:hypothetical protein